MGCTGYILWFIEIKYKGQNRLSTLAWFTLMSASD